MKNERDIRLLVLASIANTASWVGNECHLGSGSRFDVAAIVGLKICGFEIKSSLDTLHRLTPPHGFQMHDYSHSCDFVTLVCAPCHIDQAIKIVPEWWGLTVAEEGQLRELRRATENPSDAIGRLTRVMWVNELRAVADSLGIRRGASSKYVLSRRFAPEHEGALRQSLLASLPLRRASTIKPQKVTR